MAPPPVSRPSQNQRRMGSRVGLARADPGDLADGASLHGPNRLERLRRVAEILQVAREDAGGLDLVEDPARLVRRSTERLRAEDGLARLGDKLHGLGVEEVRQAYDDDVRVRVIDRRREVGRRVRYVPALSERLGALRAP